jgi:hypothetical protein
MWWARTLRRVGQAVPNDRVATVKDTVPSESTDPIRVESSRLLGHDRHATERGGEREVDQRAREV